VHRFQPNFAHRFVNGPPEVHIANTRWQTAIILKNKQDGLAVVSIARDDPSTLPGDDPFPRARMHRDRNAR